MSIVTNKVNGKSNILMLLCARKNIDVALTGKNARTSSKRRRTCITTIVCFESLEI